VSDEQDQPREETPPADRGQPPRSGGVLMAAIAAFLMVCMVAVPTYLLPATYPPEQPIAFSHRVHAGDKNISCVFCHPGVLPAEYAGITTTGTPSAGVPPLQTCMLCHEKIIIHHPEVVKVREHYFQKEPVIWAKVTYLPEFVYFNHTVHINQGIDCGHCHGDVKAMDRVALVHDFKMGWCLECHKQNNASIDCYACHR
jgi:hypothetical protein